LEFCNSEFNFLCADHGLARHKTVLGTPKQNGVAERMNRTILERVRCMLFNVGLCDKNGLWAVVERVRCMFSNVGLWDKHGLWAEAASTACYLINRSPNSATKGVKEAIWM
jgi:transposase InsO family protein